MDPTQTKIIELLREVHLIAFKEIERLNMRIVELENQHRQAAEEPIPKPAANESRPITPAPIKPPSLPDAPELLNEHQVAQFVQISVASVRRWRLFPTGPRIRVRVAPWRRRLHTTAVQSIRPSGGTSSPDRLRMWPQSNRNGLQRLDSAGVDFRH